MTAFLARVLFVCAGLFGRLPWALQRACGDAVAWIWRWLDLRESQVARRNLEIAYPDLGETERAALHRAILRTTARQAFETLRLWTRPHAENLRSMIVRSEGVEHFDAAIAAGKGVLVAAPHYGNWELLNQWLAAYTPLAILYRSPESAVGEAFLRLARADAGDRVTQIRAEAAGIRQLFKRLRDGGVVGILPDQQPKAGDGEFAPFFGREAYTMTLLTRLAERSGATVLFVYCERIGELEFALRVETAPADLASADATTATACLNAAVERIARRDPAQYQWTYKRYTLHPSWNPYYNPYRDLDQRR
jgi:Kdo2-lipid IVA lauroyltransferase/acyltransferase